MFFKRKKLKEVIDITSDRLLFDSSNIKMDFDDTAKSLMLERVQGQWTRLGQTEPFWSVLTEDKYLKENIKENQDAFWETGIQDIQRIKMKMQKLGLSFGGKGQIALELGCGTGRLTRNLVGDFSKVIALDISKPNLIEAEKCISEVQDKNTEVKFIHFSSTDTLDGEKVNFFLSLITLQHNPPPLQLEILRRVLMRIGIDGIAVFQIVVASGNYVFFDDQEFKDRNSIMEMHVLPLQYVISLLINESFELLDCEFDGKAGKDFISICLYAQKI